MEKQRQSKFDPFIQGISVPVNRIAREYQAGLDLANLQLQDHSKQNDQLREVLKQLINEVYVAPAKEGDPLSEAILEKLSRIDTRLSVAENELKHLNTSINEVKSNINRLDSKIDTGFNKLEGKIDTLLEKFTQVPSKDYITKEIQNFTGPIDTQLATIKSEITSVNSKLSETVTNKRWWIATALTFLSVAGVIAKLIIG